MPTLEEEGFEFSAKPDSATTKTSTLKRTEADIGINTIRIVRQGRRG